MKIDGTVTISIETFEKLKAEADKKDEAEKKLQGLINAVLATCAFDDKEFLKECEKINNDDALSTDRQISKALNEARKKTQDNDKSRPAEKRAENGSSQHKSKKHQRWS